MIGESSFRQFTQNQESVFRSKTSGATILVDGKPVYTHIEGNNRTYTIDGVYNSENTDSIYVSGTTRDNDRGTDYFKGILEDTGKISTTVIGGNPSKNQQYTTMREIKKSKKFLLITMNLK